MEAKSSLQKSRTHVILTRGRGRRAAHLFPLRDGCDRLEPARRRVADRQVPERPERGHDHRSPGQACRSGTTLPGNAGKLEVVESLMQVAADVGCSLAHLALAFVVAHPDVTAAIIGPRTMDQLTDLLGGSTVALNDAVLDRIDTLVPPGSNLNTADSGWVPPALAEPALRRRSPTDRSAAVILDIPPFARARPLGRQVAGQHHLMDEALDEVWAERDFANGGPALREWRRRFVRGGHRPLVDALRVKVT